MHYADRDRPSDSPITVDLDSQRRGLASGWTTVRRARARPSTWLPIAASLGVGVSLGMLLVAGALVVKRTDSAREAAASANAITDTIVRLHGNDLPESCWKGSAGASARVVVALEVGIDGKIRYASASGGTPGLQRCVEDHVKTWEFLTQQNAQTMALPFELDRR